MCEDFEIIIARSLFLYFCDDILLLIFYALYFMFKFDSFAYFGQKWGEQIQGEFDFRGISHLRVLLSISNYMHHEYFYLGHVCKHLNEEHVAPQEDKVAQGRNKRLKTKFIYAVPFLEFGKGIKKKFHSGAIFIIWVSVSPVLE